MATTSNTLSLFVSNVVAFGTTLAYNAARIGHVEDGASIYVPKNYTVSRYTNIPTGDNLKSIQSACASVLNQTGVTAVMNAAVAALEVVDDNNIYQTQSDGETLLAANWSNVIPLLITYINDLQVLAPYDVIPVLFSLTQAVPPQSANEAQGLLLQYISLFDTTQPLISDLGLSDAVNALNALRQQVCGYLQQMIAQRPKVLSTTLADTVPAVVLAYMLYQDASRDLELTMLNDVDDPMFMPLGVFYNNV
jgi:prophage DNA circulation protein